MAKDTVFTSKKSVRIKGKIYDFSQPQIMGILNITPDSFYDGGSLKNEKEILNRVEKQITEGANFIDVGGFSTRPGMEIISVKEEMNRVVPVVKAIQHYFPEVVLSCDTFRTEVAAEAIEAGVSVINDISGGRWDENIYEICAKNEVAYILMHSRNSLENIHEKTNYDLIGEEVQKEIMMQAEKAEKYGLKNIIVDPGFGFSKSIEQNFALFGELEKITALPYPVLVGISRKSMIWKTLKTTPENALNGTIALNMAALLKGADILRVHDVKETREIITLFQKINSYGKER